MSGQELKRDALIGRNYYVAVNGTSANGVPRYLGPGIAQDQDGYLYIRLDTPSAEAQLHRRVPQILDPDPRHHALHINHTKSIGMRITGSQLVVEGSTEINYFGSSIVMNTPGQTDITLCNCGGRPLYFGIRCGAIDHLVVEACTLQAHMPSETWWVSYADIKVAKYEAIPLSSHGSPANYAWPRKLYYNTIVTGLNPAPYHEYVGWSLSGADKQLMNQERHEVYDNIFLVNDGRPGGRDFHANSGHEIYDGNVYWQYRSGSPWQRLHTSAGIQNDVLNVDQLKMSQAYRDSQAYYAPGWENAGLSDDPLLDRRDYRPGNPKCRKGAIHLDSTGWPGTDHYERWRGAVSAQSKPRWKRNTDFQDGDHYGSFTV